MADDSSSPPATPGPARRRPSRRAVTLVSIPLVILVVANNVGDALAPSLVDTHPLWLMALNSRTRNLALVTNQIDPVPFYSVGMARLLISDPLFFLLGHWYGDAAVSWMERRTKTWGQTLRAIERFFAKAAYPLIFIAPNNYICLFAGAAGMPIGAFFAVNLAGTAFRLWLVRKFGDVFERPIAVLVDWIGDHRLILLVLSFALVGLSIALEARRGETEVTSLAHLDDELEQLDADPPAGTAAPERTEPERTEPERTEPEPDDQA
jgi:membrane protein DedA with SNARE-associated domain